MIKDCYCINPRCSQSNNPANNNPNVLYCQSCGSELLLNGKYRVSRLLSDNSGFGIVYEVFEGFKAKILKVLQEKWNSDSKVIDLFQREYEVLLELSNQKVTGVPKVENNDYFHYMTSDGSKLYCLVMEKVEGIDLQQWVKQHDKLNQKQTLKWLREITLILDKVHQQNWFHRDIKPTNIMLRNNGELVLIDFGTAREETQTYYQKLHGQQLTGITSAGYTPNEQQHGQAVSQSDFFALGRTFVHLLTGKHPLEIYDAVNDQLNWRDETENIDPLILDFIDELMRRLPNNRPANTQVILQLLDQIEQQLTQPFTIPRETEKETQPVPKKTRIISNKNKLRNGLLALGGIVLLGGGITQTYGYLKYKEFPSNPIFLILDLLSSRFLDKTLIGHSSSIESVSYSPNGRYLASGSSDYTIKIWDVTNGNVHTFIDSLNDVNSIDYSPDGGYLASGNGGWSSNVTDNSIKIWSLATEKEVRTFSGYSKKVSSVSYSPNGRYLAGGSFDNRIKIWDVATGKEMRTIIDSSAIFSVSYSPDGQYLASDSDKDTIKIWNVTTGNEVRNFTGHSDAVSSVSYSPDGRYLASGSWDKTIKIWNIATGKEMFTLSGHSDWVNSVSYSPDGRYLASGSGDRTVKIWDVVTGKEVRTLTGHSNSVDSVNYSPDGRYLASGSADKTIKIWRVGSSGYF
jgi:serine/threonine protein kinase